MLLLQAKYGCFDRLIYVVYQKKFTQRESHVRLPHYSRNVHVYAGMLPLLVNLPFIFANSCSAMSI